MKVQLPPQGQKAPAIPTLGTQAARVRHGLPVQGQPPFQVPPPSQPIPGIQGNPPLPAAVPLMVKSLAPHEQAVLSQAGWKPGMAVPSDMAERLAAAQEAAKQSLQEMPLPIPADSPPLEIPPETDVRSLPPEKQQEIAALIDGMQQAQQQLRRNRAPKPQFSNPGVEQAVQQALHEAKQQVEQGPPPSLPVVDDRNQETYDDTEVPKMKPAEPFHSISDNRPAECPHCGWDQNIPDTVEATDLDKQTFLQAILGNIPFEKCYDLMGGRLQLTVRTLTPEELDMCYRQCYVERRRGEIQTEKDFWERLMRNRYCLQLVDLRSGQMVHEMPRSLADWSKGQAADEGEDTLIKRIRLYLYETVFKTETIVRLVGSTVADFNRLVTKLEANAMNPDFWGATPSNT